MKIPNTPKTFLGSGCLPDGESQNILCQNLPVPPNLKEILDGIPRQNLETYLDQRRATEAAQH